MKSNEEVLITDLNTIFAFVSKGKKRKFKASAGFNWTHVVCFGAVVFSHLNYDAHILGTRQLKAWNHIDVLNVNQKMAFRMVYQRVCIHCPQLLKEEWSLRFVFVWSSYMEKGQSKRALWCFSTSVKPVTLSSYIPFLPIQVAKDQLKKKSIPSGRFYFF